MSCILKCVNCNKRLKKKWNCCVSCGYITEKGERVFEQKWIEKRQNQSLICEHGLIEWAKIKGIITDEQVELYKYEYLLAEMNMHFG